MGLFGDQMKHNLECIRGIRNAFAHAVIPITFETSELKAVCDTMMMPEICFPRAIALSERLQGKNIKAFAMQLAIIFSCSGQYHGVSILIRKSALP
jgi:hypothetical protein